MKVAFYANLEGYSGVSTYSRELFSNLDNEVEHIEPVDTLKPQLLNQLFLHSFQLRHLDSDIIHVTGQDNFSSLLPLPDKKYVVTVHDIFPYVEDFSGPFYSFLAKNYIRNLEKHADHIIAISEATKEQLLEHTDIEESRITVIYQGVDTERFHPVETDVCYDNYYIHVGSELGRKNIEGLLRIFERVKEEQSEAVLVRVGDASDKASNIINEMGLERGKDVIYESEISEERLVALYSNAESMIFPSLREGFGRPIIESLACGTPVIAYDRKPMSEIIPREMLCEDEATFTEATLNLNVSVDKCRDIAEEYTWNKTARDTKSLYKRLENEV